MTSSAPAATNHVVTLDVHQMPEAALLVDMQQRVVVWNRAAEHLLQRRAEDAIGQRCFELLNPEGLGGHPCGIDCPVIVNARRNRASRPVDAPAAAGQRERVWVTMSCSLVRASDGHRRVLHVLRDASRLHELDHDIAETIDRAQRPSGLGSDTAQLDPANRHAPADGAAAVPLTHRERQVLHLLVRGQSTSQIAIALGVSRVTARNHVTNLMGKLNATTRLQAVVIAAEMGLFSSARE